MLVGGLGGIGRATALWMAEHGARNLIFVNRSGLSNAASQATVEALKKKGVNTLVHACNVSDQDQVQNMLFELMRTAPPIRGVIQAAMVVKVRRRSSCEMQANKPGYPYREHDSRRLQRCPAAQICGYMEFAPLSPIEPGLFPNAIVHQRRNWQCDTVRLCRGIDIHGQFCSL